MLFGKFTLPLSEEGQITLPSIYREGLISTYYLTQGFDRNIFLLPEHAFNSIYSHLRNTSISDPLARLLSRLFLAGAAEIVIDHSGQIKLPQNLCEFAGLEKEIIMIGQGEYLEIWAPDFWKEQMERLNDFETNTSRFEKFHVSLT
jgi:MraZ protein